MLIRIIYILIFCVLSLTLSGQFDLKPFHKKINKEITKVFALDDFIITQSDFPDLSKKSRTLLVSTDKELVGIVIIDLATGCKIGGCVSTDDPKGLFAEEYYFMTCYSLKGEILKVKVLSYESGYGYEITAKSWLKQFIGKIPGKIKTLGDIDGISGATISVHSIVNEVNEHHQILSQIKNNLTITSH